MYSTSDFRNGLKILIDGVPYSIEYFQHVKPGKGGAFVRTKLRNLLSDSVLEKTFRAGEKFEKPEIEEVEMQYLYADDMMHFMNLETYEQIAVSPEALGEKRLFMKEESTARILLFNSEVISAELPASMVLEVSKCDPGLKGDTVSGATKPAILETGASVQVPLFINEGDSIRVDTRDGKYIERA